MIPAKKGGLLGAFWDVYVRTKVRRQFRSVWIRGELPSVQSGLLLYANHPSFWDGFAMHVLCHHAGWDGYCAMDEKNLSTYPFLRRLGAFSIRPGDGASTLESMRYARGLLQSPGSAIVIFHEGELIPNSKAPLQLRAGVELLSRWASRCLPLSLRYVFFENERPDLLIDVGPEHGHRPIEHFERQLNAGVTRLNAVSSTDGFERIFQGRSSVAERWKAVG
jgi:1-acyl-sn-glycerol-3-phosphate acyltransferase